MAYSLPDSEFIGIDFSGPAVAKAKQQAADLGLKNITFIHLDILEIDLRFGYFDYIIAYGIYSWVPSTVQNKIFEICRSNLVANGVAYLSYNTYPGWYLHRIIRDMMLFHSQRFEAPQERIEQARAILKLMTDVVPAKDDLYGHLLLHMQTFLGSATDGYLYHDHMEQVNEPVYFSHFIERAQDHGLQYLANAQFAVPNELSSEATDIILGLTDNIIEIEQYLDFLTNRTFRETVLCPSGHPFKPNIDA